MTDPVTNLKLELPTKEEGLELQAEDEGRLYSPPITKDEMTNDDLQAVHEMSGNFCIIISKLHLSAEVYRYL